jgi:hypothetical protein
MCHLSLYEDLRQSMFIDVVGHNNNLLTLSDNLEETVFCIINKYFVTNIVQYNMKIYITYKFLIYYLGPESLGHMNPFLYTNQFCILMLN